MSNEPSTTLVGNLAADPEIRYAQNGAPVCNFTVAQTPRTLNKSTNEWVDGEPLWVRCTAWNELAENIAQSLKKGHRVIVYGRFGSHSYEYNGQQRRDIVMRAEAVGPELRYATADVTKNSRNTPADSYDPWAEEGTN